MGDLYDVLMILSEKIDRKVSRVRFKVDTYQDCFNTTRVQIYN